MAKQIIQLLHAYTLFQIQYTCSLHFAVLPYAGCTCCLLRKHCQKNTINSGSSQSIDTTSDAKLHYCCAAAVGIPILQLGIATGRVCCPACVCAVPRREIRTRDSSKDGLLKGGLHRQQALVGQDQSTQNQQQHSIVPSGTNYTPGHHKSKQAGSIMRNAPPTVTALYVKTARTGKPPYYVTGTRYWHLIPGTRY